MLPAGASTLTDRIDEHRSTDGNHQKQAQMTETISERAVAEQEGKPDEKDDHSISHHAHHAFLDS